MAATDSKIICVIGDEDTVTGFLLAGIGQRDARGSNFLVVDASACGGPAPKLSRRRRQARARICASAAPPFPPLPPCRDAA